MGVTVITAQAGHTASPGEEAHLHREKILAELQRILQDPHFRHSKHYSSLLRYVVEHTLDGQTAHLKERVLGAEVFGRDPGYDTNQDPVVRTSACEIRKRLAVFYRDNPCESEFRIDLPAGSYVPEFRCVAAGAQPAAEASLPSRPETRPHRGLSAGIIGLRWLWAVAAFAAILGLVFWNRANSANGALERFWSPLWGSSRPVLLCVSETGPAMASVPPHVLADAFTMSSEPVSFTDASTTARIAGLLREHGKSYEVRQAERLGLADFRRGPVTLIGGFNNPWTLHLQERQRFYIERDDATNLRRIHDRENPAENRWQTDLSKPASELREDYAVISRIADPLTESTVVILAGLGKAGAAAAGEFVTEPAHLRDLEIRTHSGLNRKSLQAVIATTVVNGEATSPRIVAAWAR